MNRLYTNMNEIRGAFGRVLCASVAAALLVTSTALADTASDPFSRDLLILVDWFAGDFDNEEQRWYEADPRSATAEEERVLRLHVSHRRIEAPEFGEHVFYVEEYKDADPDAVIRQRLVIFTSDLEAGAIRMQQGFFKEADKYLGSNLDPAPLTNLNADDVFFIDDCDVFWTRVAGQFQGAMKAKQCVFGEGDERRYSVHDLYLAQDKYWRVDSTFLVADDSLFVGYPQDKPVKMRRAVPFICEVYFYEPNGESEHIENLPMHNQGGMLTATRSRDGAQFDVLMRTKEYPYYDTRPDFIYFSIRKSGEMRSIAFSVNDADSRTLGMRTTEVGAFCHRDGYQFRESLGEL